MSCSRRPAPSILPTLSFLHSCPSCSSPTPPLLLPPPLYSQDVYNSLNSNEPKNAELYYRLARPFARLAGNDPTILTVTGMMAERANQLKPDNSSYVGDGRG
jgi:hypothetical protein